MTQGIKEGIIFGSGILVLLAGITLAFIGIFMPPQGAVDGSVLALIGQFLVFAGSAMGIGSYTAIQIHKIDKRYDEKREEFQN